MTLAKVSQRRRRFFNLAANLRLCDNKSFIPTCLPSLMLSVLPCAWAQTGDGQTPKRWSDCGEDPGCARCIYPARRHRTLPGRCQTLTELAQRRPAPLVPPDIRYPCGLGYGGMWRQRGNGRHALIGALFGFGVGAAIGAKGNQDPHARVVDVR